MFTRKDFISLTILIFVVLGFCFYWFELRPAEIRKNCMMWLSDLSKKDKLPDGVSFETTLKMCLIKSGLKE